MLTIKRLETKGIHEVFNEDMEHSYEVFEDGEVIGYVNYEEMSSFPHGIYVEFLMAENPGEGKGVSMVEALFEQGYERIKGTSIYGPHFFWESVGVVFDEALEEDDFDGYSFTLTKQAFRNSLKKLG